MATWEECNKPIAPITPPPRPSGGDPNIVRGTFKGTTGGAMDVDIPYTGNGYPVGIRIAVKDGVSNVTPLKYNVVLWTAQKSDASTEPKYEGDEEDKYTYVHYYKMTGTSYIAAGAAAFAIAKDEDSDHATNKVVRIKDSDTLSVCIANDGEDSWGFINGVEYEYTVIYADKVDKTAKVDSAIVDTSEVG